MLDTYTLEETELGRTFTAECVSMPCCGFAFDAGHMDTASETFSCPACAEIALEARVAELEASLRAVQDAAAANGACWCTWDLHPETGEDVIARPDEECPVHAPTRDLFPAETKGQNLDRG